MKDRCPFCEAIVEFNKIEEIFKCPDCKESLSSVVILIVPDVKYDNGAEVWVVDETADVPEKGVITEVDHDFNVYTVNCNRYSVEDIYLTFDDAADCCIERLIDSIDSKRVYIANDLIKIEKYKERIAEDEATLKQLRCPKCS